MFWYRFSSPLRNPTLPSQPRQTSILPDSRQLLASAHRAARSTLVRDKQLARTLTRAIHQPFPTAVGRSSRCFSNMLSQCVRVCRLSSSASAVWAKQGTRSGAGRNQPRCVAPIDQQIPPLQPVPPLFLGTPLAVKVQHVCRVALRSSSSSSLSSRQCRSTSAARLQPMDRWQNAADVLYAACVRPWHRIAVNCMVAAHVRWPAHPVSRLAAVFASPSPRGAGAPMPQPAGASIEGAEGCAGRTEN